MRVVRVLFWELLFLFRYGFVYAYLFVLVVYCGVLLAVPEGTARQLLGLGLVYSDIAMLGLIFMGASLHLERQSGAIEALGVTPGRPVEIIAGRVGAMSLLSVTIGVILAAVANGDIGGIGGIFAGLVGAAATFSCFGVSLMTRTANLSRYIILAGIATLPAAVPLAGLFWSGGDRLLAMLPGDGPLRLMRTGVHGGEIVTPAAVVNTIGWLAAALLLAARDFRKRLVEGRGMQ